MRNAVILGVTADIGRALAERLLTDGWEVTGLGRNLDRVADLNIRHVEIDIEKGADIALALSEIDRWDLFVSSVGTMTPIGPFFELDFDAWERSVLINSTAQLRVLHALWSKRSEKPHIMFLAGGGTNNPMPNFSAYCIAKIALIKMVELIDDEASDANIFINGPGFTRTRIYQETLEAGAKAGDALERTQDFLASEGGTSMDDIYAHLCWCMEHPLSASGRNFSTVHDPWRGGKVLADQLADDPDAYRLRRSPLRDVAQ